MRRKKKKNTASYASIVVRLIMFLSKIGSVALLGFFLLVSIISLVFVMPSSIHSFATSNNNNENVSSPSSSTTPDEKEHRKTRDVTDTNQSSSSFSSQSPPSFVQQSNGDSNTTSQPGTLLITKQVVNDGGGEAVPSDFTISVDGNNPNPSSFDGSLIRLHLMEAHLALV
jgi:hypothetical protein